MFCQLRRTAPLDPAGDYLALDFAGTLGLSQNGVESTTVGVGVSSTLF